MSLETSYSSIDSYWRYIVGDIATAVTAWMY